MNRLFNRNYWVAIVCLCVIAVGCVYAPYRYSFSLIDPYSETMDFEDEKVQFKFIPSAENIRMVIKNKTDHDISLIRDRAEFLDPMGKSCMIHYGYDYEDEVRAYEYEDQRYATPMRIGPGSEIVGYVWLNKWPNLLLGEGVNHTPTSSSNINYLMEPLFPRYSFEGDGETLKGTTFNLILPFDFDEYITAYYFTFMIDDVTELKKVEHQENVGLGSTKE